MPSTKPRKPFKRTSDNAVVKDQRWGYDSIGNRTREHDLTTSVTMDPGRLAGVSGDSLWLAEGREEREARASQYSHNNANQLLTKKTDSSGQKPWMKGSLDEAGHVNLGSGPVAVKSVFKKWQTRLVFQSLQRMIQFIGLCTKTHRSGSFLAPPPTMVPPNS